MITKKKNKDKQTIITEDILINAGFEYLEKESLYYIIDFNNPELHSKYKIFRKWTDDDSQIKLEIDNGINNRGSEWHLHIDNNDCETIGSADINTVYEFNLLMEVFGSKFRL